MAGEERITAYAEALLGIAKAEGDVAQVADELFRVARVVDGNDELRDTLADPHIPVARRQQVVEDLLGGKATTTTTQLISMVVGAGRGRDLPQIIDRLVDRASSAKQLELANVRVAVPLSEDQTQRLAAALSNATGKQLNMKVTVDSSVLGGVVATIGDTVIDGTVRTRIDQLKSRL